MQIDEEDEFSRYLRLRWTRGDADRYMRPDAERYMRPDRERYMRPDYLPPSYRKSAASAERAGAAARPLEWLDDAEVSQIRCEIASLRLELALLRLGSRTKALHHSNFQPRVPAGILKEGNGRMEGEERVEGPPANASVWRKPMARPRFQKIGRLPSENGTSSQDHWPNGCRGLVQSVEL